MGETEKNYFKEILIGVLVTVIGGLILFFISQIFLINYVYGTIILIIFIFSIVVIYLSFHFYTKKKIKFKAKKDKKKPLVYGLKGKDRDEWLWGER